MAKTDFNKAELEQYIDECIDTALGYEDDVLEGKIITSQWIKKAILRERVLRTKHPVNNDKIRDIFKFFYFVFLEKGKRFFPIPFQAWVTYCLYSLYRPNGKRLRKYAIIWMGRKNGKTGYTSILSLYELMKGAQDAEVYFLATTAKQASQALKYLKSTISSSPALKKRVDVLAFHLRYDGHSIAKPLASNANNLDGLNPSFAIIDESHAHPNRDLYNIMDSGMKARDNPLLLEISTAGFNRTYPFYEQLEIAKKVLDGELEQDNTFYALYTLDDETEIEQPENWIKSNPALGYLLDLEVLKEDFEKSKKVTQDFNSFVVKNLNFFKETSSTWLSDDVVKGRFEEFNVEELKGCKAWGGIDLASTRDISSLSFVVEKDGILYAIVENFLPDNPNKRVRMNGLDITDWIDKGYIIQTNSPTTDYDYIFERINYYNELFNIQKIGYDTWNSSSLITDIKVKLGIYCEGARQNTQFFNRPLREFERLVYDNKIVLPKNPVLRWMINNVVLYADGNGNIKIMKNKSKDSVDGVVAMMEALGMYLSQQ